MAARQSPNVDYGTITKRGLEEIRRELAEAGSCLAAPPPSGHANVERETRVADASHSVPAGPRLADTPPSTQPIAEQGAQETRQQQARARPRSADTPTPALTPEQKAENLQNLSGAVFLFGAAGKLYGSGIDIPAFKAYLDTFLKDAGSPTDPVERMLLEQLALAHHSIGRLHFRAGITENLDATTACHAAAARLQAEFRRTALALHEYREKTGKKQANPEPRQTAKGKGSARGRNGAAANPDYSLIVE